MKSSNLLLLGLILMAGFLVACSDDNQEEGGGNDGYLSYVADASKYNHWTYFDFATGSGKTVNIEFQSGAVEGLYYGNFYSGDQLIQDSVKMIISKLAGDTVSVSLLEILTGMGEQKDTTDFSGISKLVKEDDQWVLTGIPQGEDGKYTDITLSGTIGVTEGAEVALTLTYKVTAMVEAGMDMVMTRTYQGKTPDNKTWVAGVDESSFAWDIAFHKYDIRTNGGAAVVTAETNLHTVIEVPDSGFETDTDGKVMADMSNMMQGFVGYQEVKLNPVLCSWVTATPTGTMPPYTYKLNSNVFIVKTKAGKYAKIKFTDTTNEKDVAVYAAFSYQYPMK